MDVNTEFFNTDATSDAKPIVAAPPKPEEKGTDWRIFAPASIAVAFGVMLLWAFYIEEK